jgi:pimeloyl-ACP methyl ester carboxylesterase
LPGSSAEVEFGTVDHFAAAGYTVFAPDLAGFRLTDNPRDFGIEARIAHVEAFIAFTAMAPRAIHGELRDLMASSLLLWGHDDVSVPGERGLLLFDGMPRAEFHMLHRCGHWPRHALHSD